VLDEPNQGIDGTTWAEPAGISGGRAGDGSSGDGDKERTLGTEDGAAEPLFKALKEDISSSSLMKL
jgi:hypothetical protein